MAGPEGLAVLGLGILRELVDQVEDLVAEELVEKVELLKVVRVKVKVVKKMNHFLEYLEEILLLNLTI